MRQQRTCDPVPLGGGSWCPSETQNRPEMLCPSHAHYVHGPAYPRSYGSSAAEHAASHDVAAKDLCAYQSYRAGFKVAFVVLRTEDNNENGVSDDMQTPCNGAVYRKMNELMPRAASK